MMDDMLPMDTAWAIELVLPGADYHGATGDNTEEEWDRLDWRDTRRSKPTWDELVEAYNAYLITKTTSDYLKKSKDRIDEFVSEVGYDNLTTACTYVHSTIPVLKAEGEYCVAIRDKTWLAGPEIQAYILDELGKGNPMPSWKTIETMLPVLEWPIGTRSNT